MPNPGVNDRVKRHGSCAIEACVARASVLGLSFDVIFTPQLEVAVKNCQQSGLIVTALLMRSHLVIWSALSDSVPISILEQRSRNS
jgi:hypothetical protein